MKTAGIIGGIGPESTIDYYRLIIASYHEQTGGESFPSLLINSLDFAKMVAFMEANELGRMTDYLVSEAQKLAQAGADFGVLAAVTPHIVFEDVQRRLSLPLISIVKVTCDAASTMGLKRVGLFGTRYTMQGRWFAEVFSRAGVKLIVPHGDEQAYIHDKYFSELARGIFLPETRGRLLAIAGRMKEQEGVQALILGGTELPLLLRDGREEDIPYLDMTKIHVEAVVSQLLT